MSATGTVNHDELPDCIHKSGDIFAVKYSFKTHLAQLYHDEKKANAWFDHSKQSDKPTEIIPAISLTDFKNSDHGRIEILCCILNA